MGFLILRNDAPSTLDSTAQDVSLAAEASLIRCAVRVARQVAKMPAIATMDWCESAARVLTGIANASTAGVILGHILGDGMIRSVEAAGAAMEGAKAPSHEPSTLLTEMRWRLEKSANLGWKPDQFAVEPGLAGGRLSHMMPTTWKESWAGTLTQPFPACEVLVGTAMLRGENADRRLAAFVALHQDHPPMPGLTDVFLAILQQLGEAASQAIGSQKPGRSIWITPKEQDVLDRLILGYSVREIAAELGRSPHTMHDHVKSLHRKLGATSRGDLIARAMGHERTPASSRGGTMLSAFELKTIHPNAAAPVASDYRAVPSRD